MELCQDFVKMSEENKEYSNSSVIQLKPISRPLSYHINQPTCLEDYDVGEPGSRLSARIENNFGKWKSEDSLANRAGDINETYKRPSESMNSLFSTGIHKSMTSLDSSDVTGTPTFDPVVEDRTICRSFTKQRKHLKKNELFYLPGCATTCSLSFFGTLGISLVAVGFLLPFGYWSYRKITSSLGHVEGIVPSYVYGVTMIASGMLTIIGSRKKHKLLIILILILSFICTVFCISSFVYLITKVNTRFGQLEDCSFDGRDKICSCIIRRGDTKKIFHFAEVVNCRSVKESLRELVIGVSALFGVGFVISILTAVAACYLLCKHRRNHEYAVVQMPQRSTNTTTQTQESCFTSNSAIHSFGTLEYREKTSRVSSTARTVHSVNNFSVSTQTPLFMMPMADLVYGMEASSSDYQLELLLDERDEPPPSYNDAIASLLS